MKKIFFILLALIAAVILPSCSLCAVDGGEEGVFIKQPLFFGDGGVVEEPLRQGSEWKVFSTNFVKYSIVNTKYSVAFDDIATDEATPLDITAHIILKIKEGKSPTLHKNYGVDWYKNNVLETFSKKERKKTEHLRALADKEYQLTMGFTPPQFIALRGLELENQKIEMIKNKTNVNVDVMLGNSTPMWDIKQK